jgi:hypothetical protein
MPGKRFQPELEGGGADFGEPADLDHDPQLQALRKQGLARRLELHARALLDPPTPHDGDDTPAVATPESELSLDLEPAGIPPWPRYVSLEARAQAQAEPEGERLRSGPRRAGRDHHPEVDRFLDRVSDHAERRITINEFCLVAGYRDDTLLGHWRRGNGKCRPAQALKFERILKLTNEEFMERLAERSRKL